MAIGANKYSDSEIAAFLTVFSMRPVSVEELHGFRKALLELCIRIDFRILTPLMYVEPEATARIPLISLR